MKIICNSLLTVALALIDAFLMWAICFGLGIFPEVTAKHCFAISLAFQFLMRSANTIERAYQVSENESAKQPQTETV